MSEVLDKPARTRSAKVAAPTPILTLGAASDLIWALREKKRLLDKDVKSLEADIAALTLTIFDLLDAQDSRKAEGKKAAISVNYVEVGNVTDWDALWPWIAKTKNFHLIQKRVSDPGLREQWALGKKTPGVEPFTKRSLSITSL